MEECRLLKMLARGSDGWAGLDWTGLEWGGGAWCGGEVRLRWYGVES